jgi:hypothetical protein
MATQIDEDVIIYAEGICCASVCTTLPRDEVAARMATVPTGVESPWTLAEDATFAGGEPHPSLCNGVPGRTHYLFRC